MQIQEERDFWAYQPPKNFELVDPNESKNSLFDYDNLNSKKELFLFRLPLNASLKQLNGKSIVIPTGLDGQNNLTSEPFDLEIDTIRTKKDNATQIQTWSFSIQKADRNIDEKATDLERLTCLVPWSNKKAGKFVIAPKSFDYYVTLHPQVEVPNAFEAAKIQKAVSYVPPKQPPELRMRYEPIGFSTGQDFISSTVNVTSKKRKSNGEGEEKSKKKTKSKNKNSAV